MNNTFDYTNSSQLKSKNRYKHTLAYKLIFTITKFNSNNARQFESNSEVRNTTFFIFILSLRTCARQIMIEFINY